jgi:hypothetical protein
LKHILLVRGMLQELSACRRLKAANRVSMARELLGALIDHKSGIVAFLPEASHHLGTAWPQSDRGERNDRHGEWQRRQ